MKTCVFITGTNCAGKTSVAKELIHYFEGIEHADKKLTACKDSRVCLAGYYDMSKRFGGVDSLNSTKILSEVIENGLSQHEIIVCEGSYFHTIGLNLTNAMFKANRHLVVYLYAPIETLNLRLLKRGGKSITPIMSSKQRQCCVAARKWQQMGVPVLTFDTSRVLSAEIAIGIIKEMERLCGETLIVT